MKRLFVIVLSLLVAACTSAPPPKVTTLPGPAAIQGQVLDAGGSPMPGVTVSITDSRGGTRSTFTGNDGRYAFRNMAADRYEVRAELAGLFPQHRRVTTVANNIAVVDLVLRAVVAETITVTAEAPMIAMTAATAMTFNVDSANGNASYVRQRVSVPEEAMSRPQYAAFEDHGFVDTAREATTTFAIDVDRASYANIRRFLMQGDLPPRDAVRIEEMINYFTYDYPQPGGNEPFSITTEVSGCPWNGNARLLRIGIQGRNLEDWKMSPNNLVFLLDVSGSMAPPNRLPLVKEAFRVLVNQLRAEDRVAIVVYAGTEGLVLPSTSGADKRTILQALDNLQSGGSTAGGAGIELAYGVAQDNFIKGGNNRVILATDGDFNVGITDIGRLQKLIEKMRETGVFLSTIGVGDDNYQDALMETLADKGNGNYAYLDSLKEAEKVFKRELTGTLVTIAKDVKVQIEFDPSSVASYRQIGYENRAMANEDFRDDTKDAGELGAGHSVTALYEIVPRGAMSRSLGKVSLRFKDPDGSRAREVTAALIDQGKSVFEASPDMQFTAAVAELGMLLRNSPHKGTSSWEDVAHLANISRGADLDGLRGEFATLAGSTAMAVTGKAMAIKE